ncbi:MAG: NlpC/P60 family protein [bacterium]|nr:NlpC/P60 family protein [bacterium]
MKIVILLTATILLIGCTPYPRYRLGGTETAKRAVQQEGMSTNDNIRFVAILQSYLGRPYTGRSKYIQGVDCSFFVGDVFRKYDETELPRSVKEQFRLGAEVPYRQLRYADLVFYRTERNKVSHVGIYVGDGRFIHASTSRGVIITAMSEKYWSQRFAGARRILGQISTKENEDSSK